MGKSEDAEENGKPVTQPQGHDPSDPYANGVSVFRTVLPQILASTAKNLLLFDLGMAVAFPTIVIPDLLKEENMFNLNISQISWFGSLAYICQPLGSLASGMFLEALGRKRAMLLVTLPHIAAWFIMYRAENLPMLFTGAVLLGLGVGFMEAPILTYVGEICQPRYRGILTAMAGVSVLLGVFLTYLLGTIWHWRTVGGVLASVPICTFFAICFIPETPMWLLSKGRREKALKSLCWLRGWVKPELVQVEFAEIEKYAANISRCSECHKTREPCPHGGKKGWAETRRTIRAAFSRTTLRPALLVLGFFVFHQFCGLNMFRPYMVQVVRALGIPLDAHWATVVASLVGLAGNIGCMLFIKLLGKRLLAMISLCGCAASAFLIGAWAGVALKPWAVSTDSQLPPDLGPYADNAWQPLALFIAFAFFMSIGVLPVPWIMLSEVFPYQTRGIASGTTAALNYVLAFVATKSYLDLERLLGLQGMFYFFGIVSLLGVVYIYLLLPETEGRTLPEIEEYFSGKKKKLMKSVRPTKISTETSVENGAVTVMEDKNDSKSILPRWTPILESNGGLDNTNFMPDDAKELENGISKKSTHDNVISDIKDKANGICTVKEDVVNNDTNNSS